MFKSTKNPRERRILFSEEFYDDTERALETMDVLGIERAGKGYYEGNKWVSVDETQPGYFRFWANWYELELLHDVIDEKLTIEEAIKIHNENCSNLENEPSWESSNATSN